MSTTKPKRTNWAAVTADEWAEGYAAVAAKHGVSREAARTAHARLTGNGGKASALGRPRMAPPPDLDRTARVADLCAKYNVSPQTVYGWMKEGA